MGLSAPIRAVCFDWGGTLMSEIGPQDTSMSNWPTVEVLEGAISAVQELHKKYILCIATNASISHYHDIQRALQRGGLARYFDHIFCYMDLGFKKTQIEFWQKVSSTLNVPFHEIAMVGDSLENDAQAPHSFGVQAVWLSPPEPVEARGLSFPVVQDLRQFSQMVLSAA